MKKILIFLFGIFAYTTALVSQIWFIFWLGEWSFLTTNIDTPAQNSTTVALLINTTLMLIFALQHSVMAREFFKRHLIKLIPEAMERSLYVLLAGLALGAIPLFWQGLDGVLWRAQNELLATMLTVLYLGGWLFSLTATFIINHFELFGLQQSYFELIGKSAKPIEFQERFFYRFIRHPIQFGVLVGIWATPNLSYSHLLLSVGLTLYILIGLWLEERDLVKVFGDVYSGYKKRVGMLMPFSPSESHKD